MVVDVDGSKWLLPGKIREYYVERPDTTDVMDCYKQIYLAVITGEVRARLHGRVLGPERLKQIAKLNDPDNPFALPPDLELSVEDAQRKWKA
jgi:hypothetical protein